MSSAVFTEIGIGGRSGERADRLFRGAVSAFCSLPRPSRHDAARIDDLTLPLLDQVSLASRRFAAAALSECEQAPRGLTRLLCDDAIEVAAPLLIRLPGLTDIELIALIGRHGALHAQAIGRRPGLNPVIASLVRALEQEDRSAKSDASSAVRRNLRGMMRPSGSSVEGVGRRATFLRLRDSALGDRLAFFETALADALGLWLPEAQAILRAGPAGSFPLALKALALRSDEAFLLNALLFPAAFGSTERIAVFLEAYEAATPAEIEVARASWREEPTPLKARQAG